MTRFLQRIITFELIMRLKESAGFAKLKVKRQLVWRLIWSFTFVTTHSCAKSARKDFVIVIAYTLIWNFITQNQLSWAVIFVDFQQNLRTTLSATWKAFIWNLENSNVISARTIDIQLKKLSSLIYTSITTFRLRFDVLIVSTASRLTLNFELTRSMVIVPKAFTLL